MHEQHRVLLIMCPCSVKAIHAMIETRSMLRLPECICYVSNSSLTSAVSQGVCGWQILWQADV